MYNNAYNQFGANEVIAVNHNEDHILPLVCIDSGHRTHLSYYIYLSLHIGTEQ